MGFRKTLEWIAITLMDFTIRFENKVFKDREKRGGGFKKRALCISVCQTNFFRATTLPWYGTELSS
jgi:hypothetical protein